MAEKINVRALALDIIQAVLEEDGYCNVLLKQVLDKYAYMDRRDRAFLSKICLGTVERAITLDAIIENFSTTKVKKMKPAVRNILRMSTYQLFEMDKVSPYAVCNEAVELTKLQKQRSFTGFVNGILRSMIRFLEEQDVHAEETYAFMRYRRLFPKFKLDEAASMPTPLFLLLRKQYPTVVNQILDAFYQHASYKTNVHILGSRRPLPQGLLEQSLSDGILTPHPYNEPAFEGNDGIYFCKEFDEFAKGPLFCDGYSMVQDFSSSVVGRLVPVSETKKVLDLCAAPGGKSLHIADRIAKYQGTVLACDLYEEKVRRIQDNAMRLRADNVSAMVWDATFEYSQWKEAFDVVICDVPCSGLGIIGNKPDIKYRVGNDCENALHKIVDLQKAIVSMAVNYVKPGGYLIYSTCTINQAENEEQVAWITSQYPFAVEDIKSELPTAYVESGIGMSRYGATFLPGVHPTEGFFVSRLKKIRE